MKKSEAVINAGKKYAEAIKSNPGKSKEAKKARKAALVEYKQAIAEASKKKAE